MTRIVKASNATESRKKSLLLAVATFKTCCRNAAQSSFREVSQTCYRVGFTVESIRINYYLGSALKIIQALRT